VTSIVAMHFITQVEAWTC